MSASRDGVIDVARDLAATLTHGDVAYTALLDMVDAQVERHELAVPEEPAARVALPDRSALSNPCLNSSFKAGGWKRRKTARESHCSEGC